VGNGKAKCSGEWFFAIFPIFIEASPQTFSLVTRILLFPKSVGPGQIFTKKYTN